MLHIAVKCCTNTMFNPCVHQSLAMAYVHQHFALRVTDTLVSDADMDKSRFSTDARRLRQSRSCFGNLWRERDMFLETDSTSNSTLLLRVSYETNVLDTVKASGPRAAVALINSVVMMFIIALASTSHFVVSMAGYQQTDRPHALWEVEIFQCPLQLAWL